jgi:hypothetical protein
MWFLRKYVQYQPIRKNKRLNSESVMLKFQMKGKSTKVSSTTQVTFLPSLIQLAPVISEKNIKM